MILSGIMILDGSRCRCRCQAVATLWRRIWSETLTPKPKKKSLSSVKFPTFPAMGRKQLFDDDGNSSVDDLSKIEIDEKFAKRLEHNKKREELQRYEELKKKGLVDSSDSEDESSSEEEEQPIKKADSKFFDALIKVKNQDPILKNKDAKLFDSDSEEEDDGGNGSEKEEKKKKKKGMYLKDVNAKLLIEEGPEVSDEETLNPDNDKIRLKSYSEEQEEMRREFLKAVEEEENDEDGEFLRVKSGVGLGEDEEDDIEVKLDDYFGKDEKLDADSMFLKDYFRKRLWIDDDKSKGVGDGEIEFSEDEEEIEEQEDYEREYNFRFEENAGDRVVGHSRKVNDSARERDNARKKQRERKKQRIAQAEFQQAQELKRLKNLKKEEIKEKLKKIREAAGIGQDKNIVLDKADLEEEFDPEEHDRKMKAAFGNDYYEDEDADPGFGSDADEDGLVKPDFDMEDELLGLPKGWDVVDDSGDGDRFEDGVDGCTEPNKGKKKQEQKQKISEEEKAAREKLMDEYYKLDYEDTICDLKTRFKYRQVKPRRYGLSPKEILMLDDKDLKQYISLKKLATYREKEWKVPRIKTLSFINTLLQKRKTNSSARFILNKNNNKTWDEPETTAAAVNGDEIKQLQHKESNRDVGTSSKRGKRKRQQAELKLSDSRLKAYGKNVATSNKKKS